ncbi:hypothetical protein Tco_0141281, partial [Tanacetum coccineum]
KSNQTRRRAKIVVSYDDMALEDSSKQERMIEEIDQDVGVTLVTPTKVTRVHTYSRKRIAVSTGSGGVSTASRYYKIYKNSLMLKRKVRGCQGMLRTRVEADEELTQKLQAEEKDKYSKVDQARMLVELINQRKRYFAAQKAEAKRNKTMTQAQQRTYMSNYIKHIGSNTMQ